MFHWTAFRYVWYRNPAKYGCFPFMNFHCSFWPGQKCIILVFGFRWSCYYQSLQAAKQMQPFFLLFFEYVAIPLLVHCFSWLIFLSFADLKVKVRDASGMWCPARCTYAVILFLCPSRRLLLCTLTYQHYPTHITILLSSGKQWYHSAPCCVFSLILLFHR